MSQKINVLVLPSDTTGVGKFRSVDPHVFLQNMYPDDFHVDIDYQPNINDINYWKKYQIVHVHRNIGQDYNQTPMIINFLKSLGIKVIVDLDDYWLPTKEHPIHDIIVANKIHERILDNLKVADYVITTTELFANEIRKFNKNVVVLPNAIDPEESQFKKETPKSDKIRIGWLGGSSHLHDLKLLDGMVSKLSPMQDKLQYYVCGFDTRGTVTELNKQTGEQSQRPIRPQETVWVTYMFNYTGNTTGLNGLPCNYYTEFNATTGSTFYQIPSNLHVKFTGDFFNHLLNSNEPCDATSGFIANQFQLLILVLVIQQLHQ